MEMYRYDIKNPESSYERKFGISHVVRERLLNFWRFDQKLAAVVSIAFLVIVRAVHQVTLARYLASDYVRRCGLDVRTALALALLGNA